MGDSAKPGRRSFVILPPMRGSRATGNPWRILPVYLGEGAKIFAMGVLLAILLFVFLLHDPATPAMEQPGNPITEVLVEVPVLNPEIMDQARDETRVERLVRESEPFKHLLEASLNVVPAAARQLGMPRQPLDVEQLRSNPSQHRGDYLWSKGELLGLSGPIAGHPIPDYDYYEGRLENPEGETVMFAVSLPPDPEIEIGDWVRIEGFFLKLRDGYYPEVSRAPMLVGPQLLADQPDWDPVLQLDPRVLDLIADGNFGEFYMEGMHSDLTLEEYQNTPLWHLTSYALSHKDDKSFREWREVPAYVEEDQWFAIMRGEYPKGMPMRVLGELLKGRTIQADRNPIGVEAWTEVWVRIHDLGGRLVPVWIPERLDNLHTREAVELRAYLFKRHAYDSIEGDRRFTPLFVAPTLNRYVNVEHPLVRQIGVVLVGLVGLIIGVFYFMARSDRITRDQHEIAMIERRRRRRQRMAAAVGQQG